MNLYQRIKEKTYIIAEMSGNHAGSLARAKDIIHAAKESGADCIKIQTYTADTLTIDCDNDYFHITDGTWAGENLYSLYQKAYTPWEWQAELKLEAERAGLDFLSTPFDRTSVDFLESLGLEFYKIASFELVDIPLIQYVAAKGKPMIISTGMGSIEEIEEAVAAARGAGNQQICLLRCSSSYPAIPKDMNLNTIADMKRRFGVPIGLSDHSMGSIGAITAVALGAQIIEKHFCLSREIENPDCSFSMEPAEFKEMVDSIRQAEKAKGAVSYEVSDSERDSIQFRKSIFAVKDIKQGEKFTEENMRVIRPGYGIKPKYYDEILGKYADRDINYGTPLKFDMIQGMERSREQEVSLRLATERDMELLFHWANDKSVRKNSFSTEQISYECHQEWFHKVMGDTNEVLFILCVGEQPVGQTRITIKEDTAMVGYSIAEQYRSQGYGKKMLLLLEKYLKECYTDVKKIRAEVKPNNAASVKVFEALGYDGKCLVFEKDIR